MQLKKILTIAGSDSGGGAGIQADIKTMSALGGFGMSAITAITAQNTCEVRSIHLVPTNILTDQISAVAQDIGIDAVKTGMLATSEIIHAVADSIQKFRIHPLVVDPVMVSTSGARLLDPNAINVLVSRLIPLADLITPNIPEAELLLRKSITIENMGEAARELSYQVNAKAVLIKGGHLTGPLLYNALYDRNLDELTIICHDRIESVNTHGTGCSLSAALATFLGQGLPLKVAVHESIDYLTSALSAAKYLKFGSGNGPIDHFYLQRNCETEDTEYAEIEKESCPNGDA